jgi:hypothetical protein
VFLGGVCHRGGVGKDTNNVAVNASASGIEEGREHSGGENLNLGAYNR